MNSTLPLPRRSIERKPARWSLPYGAYHTVAGELVLHDRRYQPLYRRAQDGIVERDDLRRWVPDVIGHSWFYHDGCTPRRNAEVLHRILTLCDRWELAACNGQATSVHWLMPRRWIINEK